MKIFSIFSILLVLTLTLPSCSNELDLTAPWKDVPIVYGMLSLTDTAQYVRVERAFLDPEKNALHFTNNPDSIYYQNASLALVNLGTGEAFDLTKIDGNDEGFVRDTGIWAQTPNYLYKINSDQLDLVAGQTYQLIINKGDNKPTTKVTTQVLGVPEIFRPISTQKVGITHGDYVVNWKKAVGGAIYDVDIVFHYKESLENDLSQFVDKSIKWKALIGITPSNDNNNFESHKFSGIEFYRWLSTTIPKKNVIRHFDSIDFIVTSGGEELKKYFAVSDANFGITGSETLTNYTNIPDGFGLFSSLSKSYVTGLNLTESTLDSLKEGYLTVGLNFE